jgi:hypothetical protein
MQMPSMIGWVTLVTFPIEYAPIVKCERKVLVFYLCNSYLKRSKQ